MKETTLRTGMNRPPLHVTKFGKIQRISRSFNLFQVFSHDGQGCIYPRIMKSSTVRQNMT